MVKIRVAPLATKVPNLDLEIDLTESLSTLKDMIEYTYSKKITQCYLQVMVRGCTSYREIPSTEDEKALAALGFVDGSIVCVGGESSPEEIAQQLIAKHLNNPLKALWEVLCDVTLDVLPVSMAIINAPGCGIEKRTTALDGTLTITSWTFRCRFEIGAGSTPLIMAAHSGRIDVLKALIEAGAQVNAKNESNQTALYIVTQRGYFDGLEALVAKGADIKFQGPKGSSLLHIAAQYDHPAFIEYFVKEGIDVDVRCVAGETPLHVAATEGKVKAINTLVECGANISSLCAKNDFTPLHRAAQSGSVEAIEALVALGADVTVANMSGYTPLHVAVNYGHVDAAKTLIEKGTEVNTKEEDDDTPLHWAAYFGNAKMVELLVAKGADIYAAGKYGFIPSQAFEQRGASKCNAEDKELVRSLLAQKKFSFNFSF